MCSPLLKFVGMTFHPILVPNSRSHSLPQIMISFLTRKRESRTLTLAHFIDRECDIFSSFFMKSRSMSLSHLLCDEFYNIAIGLTQAAHFTMIITGEDRFVNSNNIQHQRSRWSSVAQHHDFHPLLLPVVCYNWN
jgi:hypothetical protein